MLEVLGQKSNLTEVLWNFSRFKKGSRLVLEHNPHFYKRLPTLPGAYGGEFRMEPIETFQHEAISVLIDNPGHAGRVFLETAKEARAFGNVWIPKNAIIFKGSCLLCVFPLSDSLLDVRGNLEGESVFGRTIQGIPNLWCFEEYLPLAPQPAPSPNRNSPSLTGVTATQITSAAGVLIGDWREPIRKMLRSLNFSIRITDKPPSNSNSTYYGSPWY
jgi:hypothetical protein